MRTIENHTALSITSTEYCNNAILVKKNEKESIIWKRPSSEDCCKWGPNKPKNCTKSVINVENRRSFVSTYDRVPLIFAEDTLLPKNSWHNFFGSSTSGSWDIARSGRQTCNAKIDRYYLELSFWNISCKLVKKVIHLLHIIRYPVLSFSLIFFLITRITSRFQMIFRVFDRIEPEWDFQKICRVGIGRQFAHPIRTLLDTLVVILLTVWIVVSYWIAHKNTFF